jgi:putative ABC transport system permease protein
VRFFHLLWRNLFRRKVRTLFTFLSIVVAFFLFGILMAIRHGFDYGVQIAGESRLLTIHKISIIQLLPIRYQSQIGSTPGVANVTHATWFGGVYQDPKNFFAQLAVEPEKYLEIYPDYVLSPEAEARWLATRTGAVAGRKLAQRFAWQVGDRIPIQPTFWRPTEGRDTYEFELVGIYEGSTPDVDETSFFFRQDYLMERVGDIGQVGWYVVEMEDPSRADEVAQAIDAQFANSPAETKTTTERAFLRDFAEQVGNTGAILMTIVGIVFFVILLIAGNTMAQSVRERTSELGVLKTVGFTDRAVLGLVLAEAVLLAVAGGVVGLVLAVVVIPGLEPLLVAFLPVFYAPPAALAAGLGLAVLLGLASGGLPAWFARRLQITEALRRR